MYIEVNLSIDKSGGESTLPEVITNERSFTSKVSRSRNYCS